MAELGYSIQLNSVSGVVTTYNIVGGVYYGITREEMPVEEAVEVAEALGIGPEWFEWEGRMAFSLHGQDRKGYEGVPD